jgi:excisionase family DNA binding protein
MTVDEVAVLLRVNRKTIYELIARRELPGVRNIGRALRIERDAVLSWLRDGQGRDSRNAARRAMR